MKPRNTASQSPPEIHRLQAGRDFDLYCDELGPSARMMLVQPDAAGRLSFRFGKRPVRSLQFPVSCAGRTLAMIDEAVSTNFFDPETNALIGVVGFSSTGTRLFLFGGDWGTWIDSDGATHRADDIPALMQRARVPVILQDFKQQISVDFTINIFARELFHADTRCFFHEDRDLRYRLTLVFHYPDGAYAGARLAGTEMGTGKTRHLNELDSFPILWPKILHQTANPPPTPAQGRSSDQKVEISGANGRHPAPPPPRQPSPAAEKPEASAPPASEAPPAAAPKTQSPSNGKPIDERWRQRIARADRAKGLKAEEPPAPLNETAALTTPELVAVLAAESGAARLWPIVEPNLMLGRPDRTYALLSHYADLIAEKAADWPPARLKSVFGLQPGTLMIGVMLNWRVNQILAVAEENPESSRILEWLREREIDRLLTLKFAGEITSVHQARQVLNVDPNADAATVKKTWRTLLGFLNADLGRMEERAIHRKKDEIAKELHVARDILMKKLK